MIASNSLSLSGIRIPSIAARDVCDEFFKKFNINYFGYLKGYNDHFFLSSINPEFNKYYMENNIPQELMKRI